MTTVEAVRCAVAIALCFPAAMAIAGGASLVADLWRAWRRKP